VKNYEPAMSFGADVAQRYDDAPRGDEQAAVALLEQLAGGWNREPFAADSRLHVSVCGR
jgi:hypothetical protein